MPAAAEMAKLKREIEALRAAIDLDLRPNSRTAMSPKDRRSIKSEIEACIQDLDELRTRLTE